MHSISEMEVLCRPASLDDVPSLVDLCVRWQRRNVVSTQNGFLQLEYGPESFANFVRCRTIIIAEHQGAVAGYYLINPNNTDPSVALHFNKVEELKSGGIFANDSRIALGSQALLDHSVQGQGVRQMLLGRLVGHLSGRYDYLFATIPRENSRAFKAHTSDGWNIIDEDSRMYYVFWTMPSGQSK